jgi:fructoselysine-6-P-deglycase FrlB-like protein
MTDRPEWLKDGWPELREGPPWVMQEMIESEPEVLERIATTIDTTDAALLLRGPGPVTVTGCGTSEHAAMAIAATLSEAGHAATPREAFELSLEPPQEGSVIAVSHEGGTWATVEALKAARAAGRPTAVVTARADAETSRYADAVLATPEVDRSWCHTIGYTSPITAGLALAARPDAGVVGPLIEAGVALRGEVSEIATDIGNCNRLIIVGSGADRIAARELTLKIEEASHIPTSMRDLETFLHGHIPACDETTGLILIGADRRGRAARDERAGALERASRRVGIRFHRLPAPAVPDALPAAAGALLATAPPLQWMALELAAVRGVNPDLIRREQQAYREAAAEHK